MNRALSLISSDVPMFTAEDVRQFFYCPRVIYFRYVMRVRVRPTVKMDRGKKIHAEKYRPKKYEREGRVERYYNVYLSSERLGLVCLIDMLEVEGDEVRIVEVKTGRVAESGEISEHHRAQVIAQVLVVEDVLGRDVRRVAVKYEGEEGSETVWLEVSEAEKAKVMRALERMREVIVMEDIPEPTPIRGRCVDCEYRVYCSDVI